MFLPLGRDGGTSWGKKGRMRSGPLGSEKALDESMNLTVWFRLQFISKGGLVYMYIVAGGADREEMEE